MDNAQQKNGNVLATWNRKFKIIPKVNDKLS